MSEEWRSATGRGAKPLTLPACHALLEPLFHPLAPTVKRAKIDAVEPDQKRQERLASLICSGAYYIWGIAPNEQSIGIDMLGFPTERYQVIGFRHMVLMDGNKLMEEIGNFIPEGTPKELPESDKLYSISQVCDTILWHMPTGTFEKLAEKLGSEFAMQGTLGPGQALMLPSSWIAAERTLSTPAFGLRRITCQGMEELKHFKQFRVKASAVVEAVQKVAASLETLETE